MAATRNECRMDRVLGLTGGVLERSVNLAVIDK